MTGPICPKCKHATVGVEAATLWSKHWACLECRTIYVGGWRTMTVCNSPKEHVKRWPDAPPIPVEFRPKIQPGPLSRGLL